MVRQRVVERHPLVGQHAPLLARASRLIGHVPVRHRGTLGGSLAHADPAAEYPAAVVALGGELTLTGPSGSRVVPADGFFTGLWSTALEPGEIVVDVTVPLAGPGSGFAVREISRRPGDFALAGAAVAVAVDAARAIRVVRVACFGVSDRPALVVPDGLVGTTAGRIDTAAVGRAVAAAITAADDKDHALPAWYRSRLVAQVVAAALEQALAEAVQSAAAKGR
jgi:carbon-monoxide dehydrogenase medium subunit